MFERVAVGGFLDRIAQAGWQRAAVALLQLPQRGVRSDPVEPVPKFGPALEVTERTPGPPPPPAPIPLSPGRQGKAGQTGGPATPDPGGGRARGARPPLTDQGRRIQA